MHQISTLHCLKNPCTTHRNIKTNISRFNNLDKLRRAGSNLYSGGNILSICYYYLENSVSGKNTKLGNPSFCFISGPSVTVGVSMYVLSISRLSEVEMVRESIFWEIRNETSPFCITYIPSIFLRCSLITRVRKPMC